MFTKEWTARRVGTTIDSSVYCENYEYFATILTRLSNYNWLKFPIQFTDDGTKTLFEFTNGAIAHMISFYMRLQLDYLNKEEQVTMDAKCVEKLMNKYFGGLIKILSKRSKNSKEELKVSEFERMKAIEDNNLKLNADIQRKLQEAEMQKQIIGEQEYEESIKIAELEKYIVDIILIFKPEKDIQIIKGCLKRVLSNNKKDIDYNNKEQILQMVLKELDKKKVIKQEQTLKQVPRMI